MTHQDNLKTKSWQPTVSTRASHRTEEITETAPFYTLMRQNGATPDFLNICLKDGNEIAIPTTSIKRIWLNPAKNNIVIRFDYASLITIAGRNLKELHNHLLRTKISEIREYPNDINRPFNEKELYINHIEIEDENGPA